MPKSSETSVCDPHSRCESLVLNPGALLRNTCLSLCLDLSFRRPESQNVLPPGSLLPGSARLQREIPSPPQVRGFGVQSPRNRKSFGIVLGSELLGNRVDRSRLGFRAFGAELLLAQILLNPSVVFSRLRRRISVGLSLIDLFLFAGAMVVRVQYSAPVLVLLTADRFSFLCAFLFRFRLFLLRAFLSILIRCSRFRICCICT